ncbi:MAG TPA: outer membrane beta-barrel protein [Acidobacteriota bacterium]|nr:outer membrane beta-barrel protein [Acidobacteriota bacterium]
MKVLRSTFATLFVLLIFTVMANAQSGFNAYFGMGTMHDGSTNQTIDILGTGTPQPTSALGGVFGTFGGGVMLNPHFGVGAEVAFRFTQGDYAGAGYRPVLYDFNGLWTPTIGQKHVVPEIQAGFGGASLRFYGGGQYCDPYTGFCTNYAGSSNHLQLHTGIGLRFYVKPHLFVRPQFDYHWVRNLNEFASNSVLAYSIAIGFSSDNR